MEPKFNIGDKVYIIDWEKNYSTFYEWKENKKKKVFDWKSDIPDYSSVDYHWKFEYEPNFTLKGTINKREPKKLKSKVPAYKDYKYEVLESIEHSKEKNRIIYLIASTHTDKAWMKCYVQVEEDGLSSLTPKQFADEKFNASKEGNYGRWRISMMEEAQKSFPKELLQKVYDKDDNVLFGSGMVKGKVIYHYIPAEYMVTGNPFIISSEIDFDGIGNSDLPPDVNIIPFNQLHKMFPDNKFHY